MFENQSIAVTGANGGIGRAIAEMFISNGAKVAISDLQSPTNTAEEIGAATVAAWHQSLPPMTFGHWQSSSFVRDANGDLTDDIIHIGCFSQQKTQFAGYLIRCKSTESNQINASWFEYKNGRVTVMGKTVQPQSKFQLFLSENESDPVVVPLNNAEVRDFMRLRDESSGMETYFETLYDKHRLDAG